MKRTIFSIILAVFSAGAMAQSIDNKSVENDTTKADVWVDTRVKPQFPGGDEALMKFLSKNVAYPDLAKVYDVEGRVIMSFIVNTDGSISDISAHECKVERFATTKFAQETETKQKELKEQFAKVFAKEAYRVIRKMPKWIPGSENGKKIRVRYSIPIKFSIPDK